MVYLGETKQILKFRINDHCGFVNNSIYTATRSHFTHPGNSLAKIQVIQVTAIEQTKKTNDNEYRKEREEYSIRKFNTVHKGINKKY